MMWKAIISLLVLVQCGNAAIWNGTGGIQAVHDNAGFGAGDTIHVNGPAYTANERINWTKDGAWPDGFINVVCTNGKAVFKGVGGSGVLNVRFINFVATHADTLNRAGFDISGTSSNFQIIDCIITNVHREGIHFHNTTFGVVRGTVIDYVAHPGSIQEPDDAIAGDPGAEYGLVEYSEVHRARDCITYYGQFKKFRNLWMSGIDLNDWTLIGTHPDFAQLGSDGQQTFSRHQDHEAIMMGDNLDLDSHGLIQQDNSGFGDTNIAYNGNVLYNIRGGGAGGFGTEYVQMFNNTFFNNLQATVPPADQGDLINWYRDGVDGSMGGLLINTLIAFVGSGNNDIYFDVDNEIYITNNWGYAANSEISYLGTSNPLFVNTNALDFRLQSESPVRGIGTHLTLITNANGSGTSFGVPDKHRLKDGYGIVEGDLISFPGGATARIVSVNYETHIITVRDSITWTNGQRIYKGPRGHQADLGAYPYGAEFLTAATYTRSGDTYSVTPTGDARGIWVYVDYIPKHWIYEKTNNVFSITESGAVTAIKAYPMYPQTNSVGVVATLAIAGSGNTFITVSGPGQSSARPVYGN